MNIRINLRFKITFALMGLWLLTILSGASLILNQNERIFTEKYKTRLSQMLRNNSDAMREALLNKDDLYLNDALSFLYEELEPIEVMVIDKALQKVAASTNLYHLGDLLPHPVFSDIDANQDPLLMRSFGDTLFYASAICIGNYKIGDLVMLTSQQKEAQLIKNDLQPTINSILQISLFTFIIGILGVWLLTKQILKPLDFLSEGIRRIGHGDHKFRIYMKSSDEFEKVAQTLNQMLDQIEQHESQIVGMNEQLEKKIKLAVEHSVTLEKQVAETERMASVGRLAGSIAHELNNPLASILMYARLTQEKAQNDVVKANLETIIRNTVRARDTIKDLVDFTRHSKIERRAVELKNLIESCVTSYQDEMHQKGISVHLISNLKKEHVLLDAKHFKRVFNNFIQNAIDAMPNGGKLQFRLSEKIKYIWIQISDTGAGIETEKLDKIFEPFFSTKESGTGLGLFLSYEIIRSHQGQIRVQSEQGSGTIFTIKLRKETS